MTFPEGGARIKPDQRERAAKAARAVVDDGVTRKDARERFQIGWTYLKAAIHELRIERGLAAPGSKP